MQAHAQLDALLARKRSLESQAGAAPERAARLRELRDWQAARLARTYEDLQREPRYALAVDFFLSDLYGSQDFRRRDQDLGRAWRLLRRALPAAALDLLGQAIELEVLSSELDQEMVAALGARGLTNATYAAAYRAVGRADARTRQIELVTLIGAGLDRIVRHGWIGVALRLAHGPAHAAGFGVLQDFLERGFAAFRSMRGAERLLEAIRAREIALMQALYAGGDAARGAGAPRTGTAR
jgi:hypothetical protein